MCSTICLNEKLQRFRIVRISEKADNFNSRSGRFFEHSISLVLLLWCFLFLVYSKLGQSHGDHGGKCLPLFPPQYMFLVTKNIESDDMIISDVN